MIVGLVSIAMLQVAAPGLHEEGPPPPPSLAPCELAGAVRADRLAQLPPDVREELLRFFKGEFGEAGGRFNATDVIASRDPAPQRRFLRAYRRQGDWIVWYEHGGIGYHLHAVGVRQTSGGSVRMDAFAHYTGGTSRELCAASRAFFDGAQTSFDL